MKNYLANAAFTAALALHTQKAVAVVAKKNTLREIASLVTV